MNKKLYKTLAIIVVSAFIISSFNSFSPQAATTYEAEGFWIEGATLEITGDMPASTSPMCLRFDLKSSTTPNASQTLIYSSNDWDVADANPTDLSTTGVTRAYSSSYAGRLTTDAHLMGAKGMYHTLRVIDEDNFIEHTLDQDLAVQTFYTDEAIYDTINTTMAAYGFTAANYTAYSAKTQISFNKEYMNTFFEALAADEDYQYVKDNKYTDTTLVTDLFESYFRKSMIDMVYSKVNVSAYATTQTIGSEFEDVLGGNSSDSSIDGGSVHASIRDAAVGFVGYYEEDGTIINDETTTQSVDHGNERFVSFEETETQYIINFDVASDIISSQAIVQDFGLALSQIFPATVTTAEDGTTTVGFPLWVHVLISALFGLAGGLISYAIEDKKKDKKKAFWKVAGIVMAISMLFMLLAFPVVSIF